MSDTLRHRGPDDRGEWTDERCGVAFGFRRLAIIDLSKAGHQPMQLSSGRFVIMFNGEVYNFEAIREELECSGVAPRWRGHSDTEVLLAAFERCGVAAAVQRFVGMFAIALWDGTTETLHLIRERIGVKPLYYSVVDGMVVFGSELTALVALSRFTPEIDTNVLGLYTRYGYAPAPYTIYRNTWKQVPGTIVSIARSSSDPRIEFDWSLPEVVTSHVARRFGGTEDEALRQLDDLATDAAGLRMVSDVPLGAAHNLALTVSLFATSEITGSTLLTYGTRHAARKFYYYYYYLSSTT